MGVIGLLRDNVAVLLILAVNFAASIFYFFMINNERLKSSFYRLPTMLQKLYIVPFVGPLFISPFIVQTEFDFDFIAVPILGIVLALIGLSFIVLSFLKIGVVPSIKSKSGLSTTGIYSIIRHPIYGGTIILFLGLILFQKSIVPLLYLPISITLYFYMTLLEEKDLIHFYGDEYREYKMKTKKRFIPFIL
jgi:protein-S-isoprenylcysteine O-methyltransferase Ste14